MFNIDSLSPGSANGPSFISKDAWKSADELDALMTVVDPTRNRFPYCIVWTPIPLLTWLFPLIGHMGIATTAGVIRDFAGPYVVSEDNMAFGWPTKYWQLDLHAARFGSSGWDRAVAEASEEYKLRVHNLCCDNCHSHVAMALNIMHYDESTSWNMVKLAFLMMANGRYVSFGARMKSWGPFLILVSAIVMTYFLL